MKSNQQLDGKHFGKLTVIEKAGKDKGRNVLWKCECECGKETVVRGSGLLRGHTRSCGCLVTEHAKEMMVLAAEANKTHGMSRTPTWVSWSMMMQRCFNPKRRQFEDYGGRGIKPCQFVASTPANVIALIGERPEGLSIDRINNDAGYTCGQCEECKSNSWTLNIRWADMITQANNRRGSVKLQMHGQFLSRREVANQIGKDYFYVANHIG